jgi:DNA-binding response OmpR family regulator
MNVLLLEDEPDLSAVACEQIESRGHTVFPALDIAHARSIIEDDNVNIDILIADQQVPDGNGSQFAIEIKGMPRGVKVVVVSGFLSCTDVEQLEAHGVDYYNKPSLYSDIVEALIQKHFPDSRDTSS